MQMTVEDVEAEGIKLRHVELKTTEIEPEEKTKAELKEHERTEMSFPKRERPELEKPEPRKPAAVEEDIVPEEEAEAYQRPDRRKSSVTDGEKKIVPGRVEVRLLMHDGIFCFKFFADIFLVFIFVWRLPMHAGIDLACLWPIVVIHLFLVLR